MYSSLHHRLIHEPHLNKIRTTSITIDFPGGMRKLCASQIALMMQDFIEKSNLKVHLS